MSLLQESSFLNAILYCTYQIVGSTRTTKHVKKSSIDGSRRVPCTSARTLALNDNGGQCILIIGIRKGRSLSSGRRPNGDPIVWSRRFSWMMVHHGSVIASGSRCRRFVLRHIQPHLCIQKRVRMYMSASSIINTILHLHLHTTCNNARTI